MKEYFILFYFIFLVFILSISFIFAEEGIVANDNFESGNWNGGGGVIGWNSGWYHAGDSAIRSDGNSYEGNYHLRLRKNNGYVDRSADLSSIQNATLTFYAKVNSFEGSDFAVFLVSNNGVNWNTLKTFTLSDSDNSYHLYSYDLTQYGLSSNFWIAVDSEMSNTGDYLFIDDIRIISGNIQEPPTLNITQLTWHIQYNPTPTNPSADVDVWNLDLFDNSNTTIQNLKNQGVFVMCYFSAGSWEDWREDASLFPESCKGNSNGWPGEKWIDTNCPEVREIMKSRIDLGISKGCDGFDPDNMDAYGNNGGGFNLTQQDAINYYLFLSNYTHSQGKNIGLKNALLIIPNVLNKMDWAVNEQCFRYNECNLLQPVINQGKPVFNVEYGGLSKANKICSKVNELGFSSLIKKTSLDSFEIACSSYI